MPGVPGEGGEVSPGTAPIQTQAPWRTRAACRDLTPQESDRIFYPGIGQSANEAKAICSRCPVQQQCLEESFRTAQTRAYGVFGGLTVEERQRLRRRRAS